MRSSIYASGRSALGSCIFLAARGGTMMQPVVVASAARHFSFRVSLRDFLFGNANQPFNREQSIETEVDKLVDVQNALLDRAREEGFGIIAAEFNATSIRAIRGASLDDKAAVVKQEIGRCNNALASDNLLEKLTDELGSSTILQAIDVAKAEYGLNEVVSAQKFQDLECYQRVRKECKAFWQSAEGDSREQRQELLKQRVSRLQAATAVMKENRLDETEKVSFLERLAQNQNDDERSR